MSRSRSATLAGFGSVLFLFTVGCSQNTGSSADLKIIQIGTTKADLFGLPAEYRALHLRLEKCFGQPVRFVPQPDGKALGQQLALGNVAFAILSAGEYVQIEDPNSLKLVAAALNKLGQPTRKAFIVARANSPMKGIPDCKGKRFAFGSYGDLLTDWAVRKALEARGLPPKELFPDILTPPPVALEGRLYLKDDAAKMLHVDLTLDAAVVDQVVFESMPAKGGNVLIGLSRDQFKIVGETLPVPEMVVVAGPKTEPEMVAKLKDDLINKVKDDPAVCEQLKIKGFCEPDEAAFAAVRTIMTKTTAQ